MSPLAGLALEHEAGIQRQDRRRSRWASRRRPAPCPTVHRRHAPGRARLEVPAGPRSGQAMRGKASARRPVTPSSRSNQTVSASNEARARRGSGQGPVNASCGRREYGRSADRRQVDGLEILHAAVEAPATAEPGEMQVAVQERHAGAVGSEAEVLEIAAVARVGEVRVEAQPVGEVGAVRERREPAVRRREVVARQVVACRACRGCVPSGSGTPRPARIRAATAGMASASCRSSGARLK